MSTAREQNILHKVRIQQTRVFALLLLPVILLNDDSLYSGLSRLLLEWIGLLCLIVCAFGRAFSSLYIGGRKNEELVRYGVFSVVRNPLYVFSFIGTVGIGLICHSLAIAATLAAIFALYYQMVVRKEEHFLTLKFGEAYQDYMRQVPRWIPALARWQSPGLIETKPAFVYRTLRDAAMFFLIIPVTQLVEWLHAQGTLPVYFQLP